MVAKYEWIASQILTSSATSVTFSSIPGTYRDLMLIVDASSDNARDWTVKFNNSAAGYATLWMYGNGTSAFSAVSPYDSAIRWPETLSTGRSAIILHAFDYAQTNKHKTVLIRHKSAERSEALAARWGNTSAVNRIDVAPIAGANLLTGTTLHLYGVN